MNKSLIVARMVPTCEGNVADVFARSDATGLPRRLGVRERTLFAFQDLYFHLIEFDRAPSDALRGAVDLPEFRAISEQLQPYIRAYDPSTWRTPQDAMAHCFYQWCAPTADDHAQTGDRSCAPVGP